MHPQYCRSTDPETCRDILIQENHGNVCDARGSIKVLASGDGVDLGSAVAARAIEPLCQLWCIPGLRENRWSHALRLLRK